MTGPEEKDSEITGGRKKCMRQEEERFFQIIFEKNSHVLFRYICGQLNNDRETAKDVLNDVWEVLVVKFETVADLEGEEMTKWLFCVAKNKIKNQRRKHYYQNEVSYTQYQKENRNEGEAAATAEIEERMVMQNCIQNLNPMDQRIFWGRAYGFSYKELSGFCKKSEQALQCAFCDRNGCAGELALAWTGSTGPSRLNRRSDSARKICSLAEATPHNSRLAA